ncbi:hypothetical protein [Prosthecobacter sp.]
MDYIHPNPVRDTIASIANHFTTTPGTTLKPGDEIMISAMGAVSVSAR